MSISPPPAVESKSVFRFSLFLFLLASLYLAWPWLSGQVTIPWDAKAGFQPQLSFLAHALHSGQSPFWTPNVFAGMPQIADPQSLIFSLPHLLLAVLVAQPTFQQADAVAFLMLTLGGIGWMLYFRDRGWRAAGGIVAALAFAYGGSAAWRIQHIGQIMSLSWFPLAFWALNRALDRASFLWGAAAGFFAAMMVLGPDQVAWLFTLTLIAFVLWRLFSPPESDSHAFGARLARMFKPLLGGLIVGLPLVAPPLLWTVALTQDSNRPEITLQGALMGSLHPASLLTALVANLYDIHGPLSATWGPPSSGWGPTGLVLARNMAEIYFGALPFLALVAFGFGRLWALERPMRFFFAAFLAVGVYALGKYTPVFAALFELPGADLFRRPADATFPLCVFAAVIGGYCVSRFIDAPPDKRGRYIGLALVAALYVLAVGVAVAKHHLAMALPSIGFSLVCALLSLGALLGARRWRAKPWLGVLLVGLVLSFDLSLNNAPNDSTGLPPQTYDVLRENTHNETILFIKRKLAENAAPDRRDRVELAGIDFQWPNAGLTHGFDTDLAYNPMRLALFVDVTHALDHVALPSERVFSPAFHSYKSPMANLMGLRWIATGVPAEDIDHSLKPGDLPLVKRTADAFIYENKDALPRVLLPGRAIAADFSQIIATGGMPDIDYRRFVLFDRAECAAHPDLNCAPDAAAAQANRAETGSAKILRYDNTLIDIEADAPKEGGFLVLNDVWQSWWAAYVDGRPAPIFRANLMFRAVRLGPGPHRVRFRFEPSRAFVQFLPKRFLHG
ncbi:hypothetical protein K9U39_03215 [Rhodoblastus acidophilus]|uniref:YfhO family protein n=1 Tax=Candidatus Rhodoblastus alkanivorans TaxID=2954117 RepID=A0ABS9Z4Q7_9HYPH|nr:hypothetical protein [Candidatus Rhodoblastus alkanivorans]MCI4677609.1 hypothetical protein [Candidatus Rhodoblastus alkanivorans]MCI4682659.1 hypothetical protein [Candidatus Rhodoblastus alkanivorans]MDI4639966.1 hypothetical protein [Rhodoblastus acidophilus]